MYDHLLIFRIKKQCPFVWILKYISYLLLTKSILIGPPAAAMLSLLLTFVSMALAIDTNCTTTNPTDGTLILTPAAVACQDKASAAVCSQLFNKAEAIEPLPTAGGAEEDRVSGCYQAPEGTPNEELKQAAISTCPKTCGFCCVTPEYNCVNSPSPRINCATVTPTMCQSTQWREIIAQDCPSVCGFCLLGGCIDAAPDCATQPTICGNTALTSFIASNCQRTCGLCTGSSTTSASAGGTTAGSGTCGDANANCANWARNGFCTSTFYSEAQKRSTCGSTCGRC